MNGFWNLVLLVAALGCGGCNKPLEPVAAAPLTDPGEPTAAQPKLQTLKLYVGVNELDTELALTAQQVRTGMMFRTNMPENTAMLFVFSQPQMAGFWMKNCPLPLSVAYIDSEGIIREIHDMQPFNTNSIISATDQIRYALETPQGWFQRHQVKEGVAVGTDRGTLQQTFFSRR